MLQNTINNYELIIYLFHKVLQLNVQHTMESRHYCAIATLKPLSLVVFSHNLQGRHNSALTITETAATSTHYLKNTTVSMQHSADEQEH